MPTPLYNKLGDSFNQHSGQLADYVQPNLTNDLVDRKHYNIRSFHSNNLTVPFSTLDDTFWDGFRYQDILVGDPRSIVNGNLRHRTMLDLDALTMAQMDAMTMYQLDYLQTGVGNEEWTTGAGITLAKNASFRWMNTLSVDLTGTTERVLTSYFTDDLLTDFEDDNYFIEMSLPNFPAQPSGLNLALSYIDFSTTQDFAAGTVSSLRFADSLNSLTAGGDTYARWARTNLADPANIKAVRLRLTPNATFTFLGSAIRLVPADTSPEEVEVDTKRGILARAVPRAGEPEPGTTFGDVYFKQTRPENGTFVCAFNSGHNPTGNDNTLRIFLRARNASADRIEVKLNARDTQSRLHVIQRVAGADTTLFSTSTLTNILTAETDYYLVVAMVGTSVTATIYNVSATHGLTLGTQVYTTGAQTVAYAGRGQVGYSFEPYNYDFALNFLGAQLAEFGHFESVSFGSNAPIKGAQLFAYTSEPANMLADGAYAEWGDGTLTSGTEAGEPYQQVVRSGIANQGGVRYSQLVGVGNTGQVYIRGELYPVTTVRGTYRVALVDQNDTVLYLSAIEGLLPNQWNDFELYVGTGILPATVYFHFQQTGLYADTFRFRNVRVDHTTVSWESSANAGTNWQPFLDTINEPWGAVNFATRGRALRVKATLHADTGWIQGYELVPKYLEPGR